MVSALAAVCVLLYVKIYVEAVVVITPNCLFLCAPSLLAVMHSPTLLLWHCPSFLSLCCSVSFNVALWYLFMARSFRMSWLCHRPRLCCKYDFFFFSLSLCLGLALMINLIICSVISAKPKSCSHLHDSKLHVTLHYCVWLKRSSVKGMQGECEVIVVLGCLYSILVCF